jgi:hypothetical protein
MFKKYLFLSSTLLAVSTAFAAPTTQEITTRVGRGADASIQGGDNADKNFGPNYLWVKNGSSINFARKMYMRFDLTTASAPLSNLESATLRLSDGGAKRCLARRQEWLYRVWGLPDADAGENWDEKTITWNNAPLNDVESGKSLKAEAIPLGTLTVKGTGKEGDIVSFSSPELTKWLQSDTNKLATLIFTRDETEIGQTDNVLHVFWPKEQSKQPRPTLALSFKTP